MSELLELNKENMDLVFKFKFSQFIDLINSQALREIGLSQGIIYNYDQVQADLISNLKIELENIQEAIFFSEIREIRIVNLGHGDFRGSIFIEKGTGEDIIETSHILSRGGAGFGSYAHKMDIRKYIDYDMDNQAYIAYIRPVKLYFKEVD